MEKTAKVIRIITLAPILAGVMLIWIQSANPGAFPSWGYFAYTFFLIAILPVFAYPVQKMLPRFREKGREGQRHLAMIFAFLGYALDLVVNLIVGAPDVLLYISLLYVCSGLLILVFNRLFHLRASGHAAGATAAVLVLMTMNIRGAFLFAGLILLAVYASSILIKRHTFWQLLGGTLIPVAVSISLSTALNLF